MNEESSITLKPISPDLLRDLITIFTWLDLEHQERACFALNTILEDQIIEYKTKRSNHD